MRSSISVAVWVLLAAGCGSGGNGGAAGHGGSGGGSGGGAGRAAGGGAGGAAGGGAGGAAGRGAGATGGGTLGGASGSAGGAATGAAGAAGAGATRTYTTTFPLTENPISEGGSWINGQTDGLDWHDMSTTPGLAIGHQSGSSYTDGTALLTGAWGSTQSAEAVVHATKPQDDCYQEVELRLRSALAPHSCTGYEISFKATKTSGAYLIIVRWNGPVGDFTYLLNVSGAQYGVTEGDVVKATIAGNVITAYLNGVPMGHATDSTYVSGSPGMGMNLETSDATCVGTNGNYGFTRYTATAGP